jgi:hypothetical protein
MTEKFIAIAPKGAEYLYRRSSMIAVPKSSAIKIMTTLNNLRYKLKDGEVWHVYDNDWYSNDYIDGEIKRYNPNHIKVYKYKG